MQASCIKNDAFASRRYNVGNRIRWPQELLTSLRIALQGRHIVHELDDLHNASNDSVARQAVEELDNPQLEAARAELYRLVDEAEDDISAGRVISAQKSQAKARARHGL